ncbi:hypothetical protein SVAN01_03533 [Stagonosporopsis vannaccii]|nr:hypothetical protein SVAN01_03533 [Stagonosporopsis vannaccii]
MQATLRTLWLDDDIEELQQATAVFLTDRFDNGAGAYVATQDDIDDLQKATAAFLAERADGECFCLDNMEHGLPLPGEQSLLPASIAVDLARAGPAPAKDFVDTIDESLLAQMDYEDTPEAPLLDAAFVTADVLEVDYATFNETLGPNTLVHTTSLDGHTIVSPGSALTQISLGFLQNSLEVYRLLWDCDDAEQNDSKCDDGVAMAFDAHNVLCHSQASYAASFFDSDTQTMVPYASLDGLLALDDQHEELSSRLQGHDSESTDDEDDDLAVQHIENNDYEYSDDGNDPFGDSTAQIDRHGPLKINTYLSPILEEHEPLSAASNSSMDFADRRGFLKALAVRQQDFLDGDTCVGERPSRQCEEALETPDGLFSDDIWEHKPDLELAFSVKAANDAELALLTALASVFDVVQSHYWTDVRKIGTNNKQKLYQLLEGFGSLVSPESLEEFVDLVMDRTPAVAECDLIVS